MSIRKKDVSEKASRPGGRRREEQRFLQLAAQLAEIGKIFYGRGWALGTSGNFSAIVSREPLRLAITATGVDKGALTPADILQIDEAGKVVRGSGRPSSESRVHLAVVNLFEAGAVLHTHSVWSTIISECCAAQGGVALEDYEMLKGLEGVVTQQHREWLPILENLCDVAGQARVVEATLRQHPTAHGFLLRRHGLYTWGQGLSEAKRHVEILEFLLEVLGRSRTAGC